MALLHNAALKVATEELRSGLAPDAHIIQAVNAYDEVTKSANVLLERIREWYGLHYPELDAVTDTRQYLRLIAEEGTRDAVSSRVSEAVGGDESLGAELLAGDITRLRQFASTIAQLYDELDALEAYIEEKMAQCAPNTRTVAGPMVGARLIALAGSQERLAKFPASTVQILGAESALFNHLRKNAPPPKHGVIFQHPFVHRAPYWQRGRIARALAGKIAIAAKMDYFGTDDIGAKLREYVERKIEEIKKKYPHPPKRKRSKKKNKHGAKRR